MDPNKPQSPIPPTQPTDTSATDITTELAHITQEMYKKNFELTAKNKTLSLLRKIDEITLSAVTDVQEVAQQVANTIAQESDIKAVAIFLYDKNENALIRLAVSQTEIITRIEQQLNRILFAVKTYVGVDQNLLSRSVEEKKVEITHDIFTILTPAFTVNEANSIQTAVGVKSSLIYPLIMRNSVIGTLVICLGEEETELSMYQKDLVDRLAEVIGISLDNALLYKEIQDANEKLKQLDKLKDEFVSLASHELRTPMTAIKSYLWMALAGKGGELAEKQKYYLERAYSSTDRLIKLVNDMLNVSRIESGRIKIDPKVNSIEKIISDVITEVLPRAQELGITLNFTPTNMIPNVLADSDKIKEILINLIGNSFKFTPKDGTITLTTHVDNGMAITTVADTGAGIKSEDLPKLFQKFGMVGSEYLRKQNSQGSGLGLYISKSLIELHGGKIWVNSEGEGKGTTFSFSLKIIENTQQPQQVTPIP